MEELGRFDCRNDSADLHYQRHYPQPIEFVWAALTDPGKLGSWIAKAHVEPRADGRYEIFTDRPRPTLGRILTWAPPRLLEYTWNTGDAPESIVRCELTSDNLGTRLAFRQNGVQFVWIGLMLPGWHMHLERLRSLLSGQPLPFSEERWRVLQKLYVDRYNLEGVALDRQPGHDAPK